MNSFYVYKITNKINGKIYIGKSKLPNDNRWRNHLKISKGGKDKYPRLYFAIHAAINKYGQENFLFEKIEYFQSEELALTAEVNYIQTMKNMGIVLYNLTDGGDGRSGRIATEKSVQKMSEAQRGEKSWKAKLTEQKVREIKSLLLTSTLTQVEIANLFSVKPMTINLINKGKQWWWVEVPGFQPSKKIYSSGPTNSKLNEEQVREIKQLLKTGVFTYDELAVKFGVAKLTIGAIKRGERWSHIIV